MNDLFIKISKLLSRLNCIFVNSIKNYKMKTRIGILGLGGVGGYFGGLLAKAYKDSDKIEIIFIARGETMENIKKSGLVIETDKDTFTAFPSVVTDNPKEIGRLDYLICATKTYDIEESLSPLQKCINEDTMILPLYNGVDAGERIADIFKDSEVLMGCVYIVAFIESKGKIKKVGPNEQLFFGSDVASWKKMQKLEKILKDAEIHAFLTDEIDNTIWMKFIFISALASTTSFLNKNIGEILTSDDHKQFFVDLVEEVAMIAAVKGIDVPLDIAEKMLAKLAKSPQDNTSSMHRDYLKGNQTEYKSLVQKVVEEGENYEVETPNYRKVIEKINK